MMEGALMLKRSEKLESSKEEIEEMKELNPERELSKEN